MRITLILILFTFAIEITFCEQPSMEWIQRYTTSGNFDDDLKDMVLDKYGNIYIAANMGDIITLKYDPSGNLLWSKRYNGPADRTDEAVQIAVDDSGFVYVAGSTFDPVKFSNFILIKYSSEGDVCWEQILNSSDSTTDVCKSMVIDDSANIFMTGLGYQCTNGCSGDYLTVKYNKSGNLLWKKFYHGEGTFSNMAWSIALNNLNMPIVTGGSRNSFNEPIVTTVLYTSDGKQLTTANIDSAFFPKALGDLNGNIYIAGDKRSEYAPKLTQDDVFLAKYDSTMNLQWLQTYGTENTFYRSDNFAAIVLDYTNENVYVTANSEFDGLPGWEYVLLRYNQLGSLKWKKGYTPLNNSSSESSSIVTDDFNNVYITGRSNYNTPFQKMLTVKYDSSGNVKWAVDYSHIISNDYYGEKVLIDKSNNIIVGGTVFDNSANTRDILLIKYSQMTASTNLNTSIPENFSLYQNYPNPFNSSSIIKYFIPVSSKIKIALFDMLGKEILQLENSHKHSGVFELSISSENLSSGIYFYSLFSNGILKDSRKLIILK